MTAWPQQKVTEVADGVIAVLQGDGEAGVSNAGLVIEDASALVIDTMTFPAMAQGLVDELAHRNASADVVLNTHHHIDHIGGNELFTGSRLVAHPASAAICAAEQPTPIYDSFMPAFRGEFAKLDITPPAPEPSLDALDLPRDTRLQAFAPAHTAADVIAWLPDQGVLFTGDLCFFGVAPLAVQALISGWIDALGALLALEPLVVVPGHGPIGGPAEIAELRDHLVNLRDTGRRAVEAGVSLDDALADFDAGPVGEWVEAERVAVNLERAMQEARGEVDRDNLDVFPTAFARLLH